MVRVGVRGNGAASGGAAAAAENAEVALCVRRRRNVRAAAHLAADERDELPAGSHLRAIGAAGREEERRKVSWKTGQLMVRVFWMRSVPADSLVWQLPRLAPASLFCGVNGAPRDPG